MALDHHELRRGYTPVSLLRGVVLGTAANPAPATVQHLMVVSVQLPGRAAEPYGPMPWAARGTLLPQGGDNAYIQRVDNTGEWVCVAWWPAQYTQQP